MNRRILQWLGALSLLALVAVSLGALALVRDRIEVTIADADANAAPDRIDALAEDARSTREDLEALAGALGEQFVALRDALDRSQVERDRAFGEQLDRMGTSLVQLRERVETTSRELAALRDDLGSSRSIQPASAARDLVALAGEPRIDAAVTTEATEDAPRDVSAPAEAARTGSEVSARAPAAEPAADRTFLAFKLPSQGLAFDRRQRFAIVPSLSRVGFDATSTLHDFSGVSSRIDGAIEACLAKPDERCTGSIVVQAASLDTGVAARDEEMREHLAVIEHPQVRFEWSAFEPRVVDVDGQRLSGVARGTMTIRGRSRPFAMPVDVAVDASKRVAIQGQARLRLGDFGVPVPSKLGVISMDDEITVWIALCARSVGAAERRSDG